GAASRTRSTSPSPYATGTAPSDLRYSWLRGLAVPTTRAPRATAICTRNEPTPPAAACTSSVSPDATARSSHTVDAVCPDADNVPATGHGMSAGFLASCVALASAKSAYPPEGTGPSTSSPTPNPDTSGPTASTTPATSLPTG